MGLRVAFFAVVLAGVLVAAAGPVLAADRFTVTLDPPAFTVNDSAELTITITGDEDAVPLIPRVPGLVINPDGQSTSIRQVNGAVTATFARTYRVTATQEGTFTIAPIRIGNYATAPVVVRVTAAGTLPATGGRGESSDDKGTQRALAADVATAVRAAMPIMKVVLPKSHLYVGELVPVQVKAYFREGISARLDGPLAAQGDAFTVSGLDKRPTQSGEAVAGVGYTVLTWNAVLGALKSGDYPLALELPITLNVQVAGADSDMASRLRALFGTNAPGAFMDDPDFNNLFGRVIQKSVTLKPDATVVTVLPLPVDGRPANFAGAVGQFQLASELAPVSGAVGDPLTFQFTVTGKGNLSRVSSPGLADSAQWRVYPVTSKVTADDDSALQGLKRFSQPVVPLQAGQLALPGVSFSYFDPEAARYVTRATDPIRVLVAPGAAGTQVAPSLQAAAPTGAAQPAADGLMPDVSVTGWAGRSLEPVTRRSWFASALLAPLLLMLAAVTLIRRQQLRSGDPALMLHAARLAAVKINMEAMTAALGRADAPAFFTAARHALQERLADHWQVSAESVDRQLIGARLPHEAPELLAVFAAAEKVIYAGDSPGAAGLQDWHRRVLTLMDRLEAVA